MKRFRFATLCFITSTLGGCAAAPVPHASAVALKPGGAALANGCGTGPFDATAVERRTASGTVSISAGQSSGSGFLLREGREQLVVTNYHVVAAGSPFAAGVTLEDGRRQSVPLEVVLVSRDDDLALLRPAAEVAAEPLVLRPREPELGEAVAVLGYPGVAGSEPRLTFEPGTVTATRRTIDGSEFIQTNANINPGNSGGPLVDGCGRVIGVVNGKHRTTERVGLAVSADALTRLLERHRSPRPSQQAALEQQLQSFLREVRFRRNDRAARFFGRAYVEKAAVSELARLFQNTAQKLELLRRNLKKRGRDLRKMSKESFDAEVSRQLSPLENRVVELAMAVSQQKLSMVEAANQFLSWSAADQFGTVDDVWVEGTQSTKQGCMDAYVTAGTPEGARRYVIHLHYEWGEWLVQSIQQVR